MADNPGLIDLHHHSLFPAYIEAMMKVGVSAGGGYSFPNWNAEEDLAMLDRQGIAVAVLSMASPGVYINTDVNFAERLARRCNETIAELGDPIRRGLGASLCCRFPTSKQRSMNYDMLWTN